MNKKLQFIFLPTDKASEIFSNIDGELHRVKLEQGEVVFLGIHSKYQYLYILSEDKIMHGDYFYSSSLNKIMQSAVDLYNTDGCKKVIATTNPELHTKKNPEHNENSYVNDVPKISQSDIEYIISLHNEENEDDSYNGNVKMQNHIKNYLKEKDKRVNVEKKTANEIKDESAKECGYKDFNHFVEYFKNNATYCADLDNIIGKIVYKYTNENNTDNKFGSANWKLLVDFYMYLAENGRLQPKVSKFNNEDVDAFIKSIDKESLKINTIMVEYENVNAGWQQLANSGKQGSAYVPEKFEPKIKDGNIVIARD